MPKLFDTWQSKTKFGYPASIELRSFPTCGTVGFHLDLMPYSRELAVCHY